MENEIKLLKNNDKKDWSDIEWVREFYEFLQGNEPETIKTKQPLKLSKDEAFTVIWYLQEHFSVFPDTFEKCDNCGELFDYDEEGFYSEEGNEIGHHFCGNCDHLAPYENEDDDDEDEKEHEKETINKIKTMRKQEEIDRQIKGLEQEKKMIPPISLFGTNNHKIIDYQIKTLKGEFHPEDADPDDDEFESDDEFTDIIEKAEETQSWLNGEDNDDLFEDYSDLK